MKNGNKNAKDMPPPSKRWRRTPRPARWIRREFLALASIFGASTAAAYGMIGLAAPSRALAQTGQEGRRAEGRHVLKDQRTRAPTTAGNGQRHPPVPRTAW